MLKRTAFGTSASFGNARISPFTLPRISPFTLPFTLLPIYAPVLADNRMGIRRATWTTLGVPLPRAASRHDTADVATARRDRHRAPPAEHRAWMIACGYVGGECARRSRRR